MACKKTGTDAYHFKYKQATAKFGPMGTGWGLRNLKHEAIRDFLGDSLFLVVPEGELLYMLDGTDKYSP